MIAKKKSRKPQSRKKPRTPLPPAPAPPTATIKIVDTLVIANSFALAMILGVSRDQVDDYVKLQMPKIALGEFNVRACVEWHTQNIQRSSPSKNELQQDELKLKIRERELDLQEREGALLNKASVVDTLGKLVVVFKTTLQTLPRKLAVRLQGLTAPEIEDILAKGVRSALQELSNGLKIENKDE